MEIITNSKGIENDGVKEIDGKDSDSDSVVPTSVCDGSESPRGSQSSGGSKEQESCEPPAPDDFTKVPEAEFKSGRCKTAPDHQAAATNMALDSDDVVPKGKEGKKNEAIVLDIPDQMEDGAAAEKPESETKGDAVVGRCNDAMDSEDTVETKF